MTIYALLTNTLEKIQLILFPECKMEVCVGEIANVQRKSSKEPKTIPLMMTLQFGLIGYWTAYYLSAFLALKPWHSISNILKKEKNVKLDKT